jgi:N,N'-diacetyllegionaminate synthase
MKNIQINSFPIGDGFPCYIIAEIGNLFTNFLEAKRLIDSALMMNVNAIKFQTWDAETLTTKKNFFDLEVTGNVSQYEFHKNIQITEKLQFDIIKYAKEKNMTIFSAPSHMNDVDVMEKMDLPAFKIGSDLACHIPLLKRIAKLHKPIILSTGMCTLDEVRKSVNSVYGEGNDQLILLHCISDYPTKIEESNLNTINEMKKEFNIPIGFSDHSVGPLVSLSAAIMGSNVIEKHLKHPKNSVSPDDAHALNPEQFSDLIKSIRLTESAKGSGKKIPSISEQKNLVTNRVSIIAMQEIKKGSQITSDMIDIRRPGYGLSPSNYDNVLTKIAKLDISKETPLTWDLLE